MEYSRYPFNSFSQAIKRNLLIIATLVQFGRDPSLIHNTCTINSKLTFEGFQWQCTNCKMFWHSNVHTSVVVSTTEHRLFRGNLYQRSFWGLTVTPTTGTSHCPPYLQIYGLLPAAAKPSVIFFQSISCTKHHLVVCSQVVNLFFVDQVPKIFANELHCVQFILEPWAVTSEPKKDTTQ